MEKESGYSVHATLRDVIPFTQICTDKKYLGKFNRYQFPLKPAFATTVHKAQGITAKAGVVLLPSEGRQFVRGLAYVGISRATAIVKLCLLRCLRPDHFTFGENSTEANSIRNEYKRLAQKFHSRREPKETRLASYLN